MLWQLTQCADGPTGRVFWRIFRHPEGKRIRREYAKTEEGFILEFEDREQSQRECDARNGKSDTSNYARRLNDSLGED